MIKTFGGEGVFLCDSRWRVKIVIIAVCQYGNPFWWLKLLNNTVKSLDIQ